MQPTHSGKKETSSVPLFKASLAIITTSYPEFGFFKKTNDTILILYSLPGSVILLQFAISESLGFIP